QRQALWFIHARRQSQVTVDLQSICRCIADRTNRTDVLSQDSRIGLPHHVRDAPLKVHQPIEAGFATVDEDQDRLEVITPGDKTWSLAGEGALDGAPLSRRCGVAELIANSLPLNAAAADQQAGLRVVEKKIGMTIERQRRPFSRVYIDFKQH